MSQGMRPSPESTLRDLKQRLVDHYPLSSIVKELLQNAEDACSKTAGAGRLDFAWVSGLPRAEHPLLRGPGLVVVNDGELTKDDCEALGSYGINHKAGDRSTIGRFGLGQKSVFHLGEAFFYASSTLDGRNPGRYLDEVVSPWFDPDWRVRRHEDWEDFGAGDRALLRSFLAPLLASEASEHWFCLWVPLRREGHTPATSHPIKRDFPGDEAGCPAELLGDKTALFVAGALPLLRHLHTVRGWCHWAGPDSVSAPTFAVTVESGGARSQFPDPGDPPGPPTGGGTITVTLASGEESWPYAVSQAWQPDLKELQCHADWPMTFTMADEVKEKAEPHAAVSVVCRPGPTPSLSVRNAVFLPLRDDTAADGASPGEVTVLLHGCVFVDAGRGEAKAGEVKTGEERLRSEWNARLTAEGTRPRLIPALAQLCRDVPGVAATLTASLAAHAKVTAHFGDFCAVQRWLCRWSKDGAAYAEVSAAGDFYQLPDFGDDATLPLRAMPGLAEFSGVVVAVHGRPRLSASGPSLWPDDALVKLLAIEAPASLAALGYLARFVESQKPLGAGAAAALTATLREVYSSATTGELRANADALDRLTAALPEAHRLGLTFAGWGDKVRGEVAAAAPSVLVIPEGFGRDGDGQFPTAEATAVLGILAREFALSRSTTLPAQVVLRSEDPAAVLAATRITDLMDREGVRRQDTRGVLP